MIKEEHFDPDSNSRFAIIDDRFICRYDGDHKKFLLGYLRRRWGKIYRVKLGKHKIRTTEIAKWIEETIPGEWYHSDGHECYYFQDDTAAVLFKLRWFGVNASENEGEKK